MPVAAQTTQKIYRIGFLAARSRSTIANPDVYYDAFVRLQDANAPTTEHEVIEMAYEAEKTRIETEYEAALAPHRAWLEESKIS